MDSLCAPKNAISPYAPASDQKQRVFRAELITALRRRCASECGSHETRRLAHDHYAGLDVSLEKTAICILNEDGIVIRELVAASDPAAIAQALYVVAPSFRRVGLEAGPLAPWLYAGLADLGLPAICIEVRQMRAFAKASPVKTDKRDARLIAQAIQIGGDLARPPYLPRAIHGCLNATFDIFANGLGVSSGPPRNRSDRHPLTVQLQYHHQFSKSDHPRTLPAQRGWHPWRI